MAGMKGIHLKPLLSFKILQVHKSVKHTELCLSSGIIYDDDLQFQLWID